MATFSVNTTAFDSIVAQGGAPVLDLQYDGSAWTARLSAASAGNPVTDALAPLGGFGVGTGASPMLAMQAMIQNAAGALKAAATSFSSKATAINAVLVAAGVP